MYSQLESLPRNKLRELQDEKLRTMIRYVYERVPFYQRCFQGEQPAAHVQQRMSQKGFLSRCTRILEFGLFKLSRRFIQIDPCLKLESGNDVPRALI